MDRGDEIVAAVHADSGPHKRPGTSRILRRTSRHRLVDAVAHVSQNRAFVRKAARGSYEQASHHSITRNLCISRLDNIHALHVAPAAPAGASRPAATVQAAYVAFPAWEELNGKVVLLFFWAHWCSECRAEGPTIEKLLNRYRSQGLAIAKQSQGGRARRCYSEASCGEVDLKRAVKPHKCTGRRLAATFSNEPDIAV